MSRRYASWSPADTGRLAARLAAVLKDGDCLAVYGDLGAGKTVFAAALKAALGAAGEMQSPTFTILRSYEPSAGGPAFHHFDAYRLSGPAEWFDLGFAEIAGQTGVSLIEWADVVDAALPPHTIRLSINRSAAGDDARELTLAFPEGDSRADLEL